jgi:hypothetical protein
MNRAIRVAAMQYCIRIGCFGWTLFFMFQMPFWPAALVGWIGLAMLFVIDFL